ncbi:MAG: glucose PTS transporter subunit IIA [Propionibacteriaceae bacterium]|nr:PTS glucose transporter subunit IIA [Micropruina sp.]HBX82965.1 hypothetical protein [Propionibacteriaceae bacterium]HBY22234.1 hypothetical protein [Propionibacteriaceae bacterium]
MTSKTATLAEQIAPLVGGPENVSWMGVCTTRLRFIVKDEGKVDLDALGKTPGVVQALRAGGQIQVVIGTHVENVRDQLVALNGWTGFKEASGDAAKAKGGPMDVVFDFLGGTFQPLIPPITGAAIVQVIALLIVQFGWVDAKNPTYLVLSAAGNAIFYFLPVFVGFTASRKLGANPFIGATIAAALLHPDFMAIGKTGDVVQAFGVPLFMYNYASSMFPALLMALALGGLDRLLKKGIPQALQQVFVPTFELLLLVPLTALVFGPIGAVIGAQIGAGTSWLSHAAPWAFYVIVPAVWIVLVALGIHWAVITVAIAELASGSTTILGAAFGYQYAMMGVALAVLIKALMKRDEAVRGTAAAASLAVVIGGITEPTLYGLVLRYRRVLVIEVIAAAASGAALGIFNTVMVGFSPAPILALPLMKPVLGGVIGLIVACTVAIVLVQIWGYEKKGATPATDEPAAVTPASAGGFRGAMDTTAASAVMAINAPLEGTVRPLSETGDPVFSSGLIGPGVAIAPSGRRVVAPCAATVVAAPNTGHAIGLRTDAGLELLIHVGIETVRLGGKPFTVVVEAGQHVAAGQLLLEFDPQAIEAAGCSLITPVVVTNLAAGQEVNVMAEGAVTVGQPIFVVRPKSAAAALPS